METICINNIENIAGIVGMVVTAASTVANFLPAPDKITNPVFKILSRVIHFIAVDITTSLKK